MTKNISFASLLLCLLCLLGAQASCPQALLETGSLAIEAGTELLSGAVTDSTNFQNLAESICQECELECDFLNDFAEIHESNDRNQWFSLVADALNLFLEVIENLKTEQPTDTFSYAFEGLKNLVQKGRNFNSISESQDVSGNSQGVYEEDFEVYVHDEHNELPVVNAETVAVENHEILQATEESFDSESGEVLQARILNGDSDDLFNTLFGVTEYGNGQDEEDHHESSEPFDQFAEDDGEMFDSLDGEEENSEVVFTRTEKDRSFEEILSIFLRDSRI